MLRVMVVAAMTLCLTACFAPPSRASKLADAARELNVSSRFGRLDVAAQLATKKERGPFLTRRLGWGHDIRVLDVELAGMDLTTSKGKALVDVDVQWTRLSEGTLRVTRVRQTWRERDGQWRLDAEKRASGDVGLLGEHVEVVRPVQRDVHFPSRTLMHQGSY